MLSSVFAGYLIYARCLFASQLLFFFSPVGPNSTLRANKQLDKFSESFTQECEVQLAAT